MELKERSKMRERLGRTRRALDWIFKPKSVAVIGATERAGSVGRTVLWNLLKTPFGGTVYPVNVKANSILGVKAYPNIESIPEKVDLAVMCTPAATIPGLIKECVEHEVGGAVVISAGFKEMGAPGVALEHQLMETIKGSTFRIIGPNCLGIINPVTGVNASFAGGTPKAGKLAFLTQSGALGTAVLDWAITEGIGMSAFASIGSMLDVDWGDLIDYFGEDPNTKAILLYQETIGDARAFLSAAREVALTKPIILMKAGRTDAAAKAAVSHTGSLAGSDSVIDAAFKRAGVMRVDRISDLFYMAEVLAKQPLPRGKRLTMITNAGGPGVLATDALVSGGGELTPITPETMANLDKILPPFWSHNNPIDVLGDADATRYAKTVEVIANDPSSDGILVILTPQDMTDPVGTADAIKDLGTKAGKPVLTSWMGGQFVAKGSQILKDAGIPMFEYPDSAARVFNMLWQYKETLSRLYETPAEADVGQVDKVRAEAIISNALKAGRTLLNEAEAKEILESFGFPTVPTKIARNESEAVNLADKMGYPIVLKIYSETITHKSDIGGVKLDLKDANAVRQAYHEIRVAVETKASAKDFQGVTVQPMIKLKGTELIIGSTTDIQLGPVVMFGAGGVLVEVFKDSTLGLPPLNRALAKQMIESVKISKALKGARGAKPVDIHRLSDLLVRFSQLVVALPQIKEIDMNPVMASAESIVALDARVVLHNETDPAKLPKPAIRPYPSQYIEQWKLNDDTPVIIRPIRPEDEPLMVKFHQNLSEETVRMRYFQTVKLETRTTHERLSKVCFTDFDREMAVVAEVKDAKTGEKEILGVARLSRLRGTDEAEFAIVIGDKFQNKGLGTKFLRTLVTIGKAEKLSKIMGYVLPENVEMLRICHGAGFHTRHDVEDKVTRVEMELS